MTNYVYTDGSPVENGICVLPDHWEQTFTVKISSLRPLTLRDIMDLLQKKYKVLEITKGDETCFARGNFRRKII